MKIIFENVLQNKKKGCIFADMKDYEDLEERIHDLEIEVWILKAVIYMSVGFFLYDIFGK